MALGLQEVVRRLGFHPATERTIPIFEENRHRAIEYALYLDETLPEGIEKDNAMRALQECAMWSNAAVACNSPLIGDSPSPPHDPA